MKREYISRTILAALIISLVSISGCNQKDRSTEKDTESTSETEEKPNTGEFSKNSIQVGVIVLDLEKSLDFYTNVIGMTKTGGFDVNEEIGQKTGLTGGVPFSVAVLRLEDSEDATEWKIMSFNKDAAHPEQQYIQDDTGMQYITIFVKSMQPFLNRIEKHGIELLGDTPFTLEPGLEFVLIQDPDGVFIELIGPK